MYREFEKILPEFMQAPVQTHEKVCDENESTIIRKKQCKRKKFLMERGHL